MSFENFFFGKRDFKSKQNIIEWVKKSPQFNIENENLDKTKAILLYKTTNRSSWIVKTNRRVYKIIDDRFKKSPIINWSISIEEFNKLKIQTIPIKNGLGQIIFPNKIGKKYYFDENLFQDTKLELLLKK